MQKEIEAVARAWMMERAEEDRVVREIMAAIAAISTVRSDYLTALSEAVRRPPHHASYASAASPVTADDVTAAISRLRNSGQFQLR